MEKLEKVISERKEFVVEDILIIVKKKLNEDTEVLLEGLKGL